MLKSVIRPINNNKNKLNNKIILIFKLYSIAHLLLKKKILTFLFIYFYRHNTFK